MDSGANNGNILYLFSSNQMPQYETDAIDSVCKPSGLIMHFRYEYKYIDDNLASLIRSGQGSSLKGMKVFVVFVNVKGRGLPDVLWEPEFLPLRTGSLIELKREDGWVHFYFELSDEFVDYSKYDRTTLHNLINKLQYKPEKGVTPGTYLPGKFAALQSPLQDNIISKDQSARVNIIENLLSMYHGRIFYWFEIKERKEDNSTTPVNPARLPGSEFPVAGFELYENMNYSLILHLYFNSGSMEFPKVDVHVIFPSNIDSDQNLIHLGNSGDVKEIRFTPMKPSSEHQISNIQIRAQASSGDVGGFDIPVIVKQRASEESKEVFVLMPLKRKNEEDIYEKVLKPVIESLGYQVSRADKNLKSGVIINQIYESIRNASLIVADVSGRNPNVFYELGYANALGKRYIIITRSKKDVPFDIEHLRYFKYRRGSNVERLKERFRKIFKANLESNS